MIESMDTSALETAIGEQQRVWTARRQVLERRKGNIDRELETAVEKTDALKVLVGNEFSETNARLRVGQLRHAVDAELDRWRFNEATQKQYNLGRPTWDQQTRVMVPSVGLVERMLRDMHRPVSAEMKEREAVKIVDLVAGGYEDSVMMFRLVVDHGEDVKDFVSDYASELGLERKLAVPF